MLSLPKHQYPMIIFLHGPDTYRSRQQLKFYKEGFVKKYDPSGLNAVTLDGEKLTLEDFRSACSATGFLAKKRLIIVENLIEKHPDKKIQQEIVEYLDKDWDDDNILIFWEEEEEVDWKKKKKKANQAQPLLARLEKEKEEIFELLSGEKLNRWVKDEIKKRAGRIDSSAVLELVSMVGADLWQIVSEIDKLVSYKNKKIVTADDVHLLVKTKFDDNIFHLTDALAEKNAPLSFRLIHDQIQSGAPELYILAMLTRQFRILLQVKEIIEQEPNYYTVASRLGLYPFVAQKAILAARKFTMDELKNIYRLLLEIDIKIKIAHDDPRTLFDLLIMKICQK